MRARVRKEAGDVQPEPERTHVPWSVRAAATLPRGARVSNPLLGEAPEGSVAVLDTGVGGHTLAEVMALSKRADAALVVLENPGALAVLQAYGFRPFMIKGSDLLFAASYDLPSAPWLLGDFGLQGPPPSPLTEVTRSVEVQSIGLLSKSAHAVMQDAAEERYVLGVVLEPDTVDSQGDTITADEIRQAAHRFMEGNGNVGLQHQVFVNGKVKILETYVAPMDFAVGDEVVKAGTWLMAFRIVDDSIWQAVKAGVLDGLSIGGTGLRIPLA